MTGGGGVRRGFQDVGEAVFQFFETRGGIPGAGAAEQLACLYLDAGVLDSMQIVEMILELEARFGIRFAAEHLQSDEFQTVGGVIAIVEGLRAAALSR